MVEEGKVKLGSPICKQCGELDIERIQLYFQCERGMNICHIFLKVLRIFDPQYTLEEVIEFKALE